MRLIDHKTLVAFYTGYPDAKRPLEAWYTMMKAASFGSLVELRTVFPSADQVGKVTVFNIKGNDYRLITALHYNTQIAYLLEVMTHGTYSKGSWKTKYQIYD